MARYLGAAQNPAVVPQQMYLINAAEYMQEVIWHGNKYTLTPRHPQGDAPCGMQVMNGDHYKWQRYSFYNQDRGRVEEHFTIDENIRS